MNTYNVMGHIIEAESFTNACQILAKRQLLKDHTLTLPNGESVEVEYLNLTKKGEGDFYKKISTVNGRVVFAEAECYHSPETFKVFHQEDGTYTSLYKTREGKAFVKEQQNLAEVFASAKRMCRNWRIGFNGFLRLM